MKDKTKRHFGRNGGPRVDLLSKYFRCGFRAAFSGVLKRVFAGIASIKKYEVTIIREYHSDDIEDCSKDSANSTCFIAEFNLQIDISEKMQNGRTLKESLDEAMIALKEDSSNIIKPKEKTPSVKIEERHYKKAKNLERVKILKSSKVKVPGQNAVPFAAVTLTILILAYK